MVLRFVLVLLIITLNLKCIYSGEYDQRMQHISCQRLFIMARATPTTATAAESSTTTTTTVAAVVVDTQNKSNVKHTNRQVPLSLIFGFVSKNKSRENLENNLLNLCYLYSFELHYKWLCLLVIRVKIWRIS